eukprot:7398626-Pyramimonas_sp.AAC.1
MERKRSDKGFFQDDEVDKENTLPGGKIVKYQTTMHHTLPFVALKTRPGWRETQDVGDWDFFYACTGWIHENLPYGGHARGGLRLLDHQKVNHFPNHIEVSRD